MSLRTTRRLLTRWLLAGGMLLGAGALPQPMLILNWSRDDEPRLRIRPAELAIVAPEPSVADRIDGAAPEISLPAGPMTPDERSAAVMLTAAAEAPARLAVAATPAGAPTVRPPPAPGPTPTLLAALARAPAPVPIVHPPAPQGAVQRIAAPLGPADIVQIAEAGPPRVHVPQLHEPGLVPGGPTLADKTAAMQVALPPPSRQAEAELAALQADAPLQLTLRVGGETVGKVAIRMSEQHTIDVQLSGLLDALADRFPAAEFSRLRDSGAAQGYVSLDDLRAVGLSLRYDPVYDELRLSA